MDGPQLLVTVAGSALIVGVLVYFFGPSRPGRSVPRRGGRMGEERPRDSAK
jgi:hypothetical protein